MFMYLFIFEWKQAKVWLWQKLYISRRRTVNRYASAAKRSCDLDLCTHDLEKLMSSWRGPTVESICEGLVKNSFSGSGAIEFTRFPRHHWLTLTFDPEWPSQRHQCHVDPVVINCESLTKICPCIQEIYRWKRGLTDALANNLTTWCLPRVPNWRRRHKMT